MATKKKVIKFIKCSHCGGKHLKSNMHRYNGKNYCSVKCIHHAGKKK